jgi:2-iminoacetate synthase ThiH
MKLVFIRFSVSRNIIVMFTSNTTQREKNLDFRLDTPDRVGTAGIHKIGLGVLLGLEDYVQFFSMLCT